MRCLKMRWSHMYEEKKLLLRKYENKDAKQTGTIPVKV